MTNAPAVFACCGCNLNRLVYPTKISVLCSRSKEDDRKEGRRRKQKIACSTTNSLVVKFNSSLLASL